VSLHVHKVVGYSIQVFRLDWKIPTEGVEVTCSGTMGCNLVTCYLSCRLVAVLNFFKMQVVMQGMFMLCRFCQYVSCLMNTLNWITQELITLLFQFTHNKFPYYFDWCICINYTWNGIYYIYYIFKKWSGLRSMTRKAQLMQRGKRDSGACLKARCKQNLSSLIPATMFHLHLL